jgi:hypothetical protein
MARRLSIDRGASSITDRSRRCSKAGRQGTSWTLSLSSTMANRPQSQDLRHKLAIGPSINLNPATHHVKGSRRAGQRVFANVGEALRSLSAVSTLGGFRTPAAEHAAISHAAGIRNPSQHATFPFRACTPVPAVRTFPRLISSSRCQGRSRGAGRTATRTRRCRIHP